MRSFDAYMKTSNPWDVVAAASHSDAAARAAVSRIIDTMLEIQLDHDHINPGWPPLSATALAMAAASGEHLGGGYSDGDPMLAACSKYMVGSEWHRSCAWLFRQIPPRQAAAVLIQGARVRPEKSGVGNWWCKTIRELHHHQDEALRRLHLKGLAIGSYSSVRRLQESAADGREKLYDWVRNQQGENNHEAEQKGLTIET